MSSGTQTRTQDFTHVSLYIYGDFMITLLSAIGFEVRVYFSILVMPSKEKVKYGGMAHS